MNTKLKEIQYRPEFTPKSLLMISLHDGYLATLYVYAETPDGKYVVCKKDKNKERYFLGTCKEICKAVQRDYKKQKKRIEKWELSHCGPPRDWNLVE